MKPMPCPCKSGQQYQNCCEPFHMQQEKPKTCEQLMRSRFSAFCLQLGEYLFNTYHIDYRGELTVAALSEASLDWKNLEIIATETHQQTGFVEFKAWYTQEGHLNCHHERSNFVKDHDQWLYCDGTFYPSEKSGKISRNDACPCGSGKKYKKCCGQ
ncbi:YchJ family protein [Psychromonas algicola]|uniref:YchJ family protein n=1 Tax=Psychromonas algicola TaxID=2555642 RepID=UPI0010686A67|nr:YchJ family protein [Psychromonas sp. RZ5]TEW49251.1 YchJ family protein [Psychromonas sp. RZ5]